MRVRHFTPKQVVGNTGKRIAGEVVAIVIEKFVKLEIGIGVSNRYPQTFDWLADE